MPWPWGLLSLKEAPGGGTQSGGYPDNPRPDIAPADATGMGYGGDGPFRVHHEPRSHKKRIKASNQSYGLTWERRQLPGAGAGQYAFETYGLPQYSRYGFGNIPVTNPLRETFPASYVFQAVGIVGIPPTSLNQGQFITQPIMDPDAAAQLGITLPGAVPGSSTAQTQGPNAIVTGYPTLGP